jgi:hypothetical protein
MKISNTMLSTVYFSQNYFLLHFSIKLIFAGCVKEIIDYEKIKLNGLNLSFYFENVIMRGCKWMKP